MPLFLVKRHIRTTGGHQSHGESGMGAGLFRAQLERSAERRSGLIQATGARYAELLREFKASAFGGKDAPRD